LYPEAKSRFDTVPASEQVTVTTEPFVVILVCEATAVATAANQRVIDLDFF
jgi:hypothetical protein